MNRCRLSVIPCALMLAMGIAPAQAQQPDAPYRDAALPIDERVRDLLGRMTPEEKFWQLFMIPGNRDDPAHDYSHGVFGLQIGVDSAAAREGASAAARAGASAADVARAHARRINAIQHYFVDSTRLGIPIIPFDEALHGVMREGAIVYPHAIAMAATFDTALIARATAAIARATRSRGIRQALSPVVNIASDVRWGRVEETYGEDVALSSAMGRAFVREFERAGVIATPKHFVANVGEGGRDSYPIDVSRRMLEERYFPPFRSAIQDAGAHSVMTAYNSVDGLPSTQNGPLLNGTLKRDWGFTGFVISDAAATGGATVLHHTEASTATATKRAFEAGLDVVFQSSYPQHRPYLDAFRRGMVHDSVRDAAVSRVLRAKFELGLFERPYADPDSAAHWNGHADHRALAREVARASIVLLKNDNDALPLAEGTGTIAVIGTDAIEGRYGGYSGPGIRKTTILDGIRAVHERVLFAPGPGRSSPTHVVVPATSLSHDASTAPGSTRDASVAGLSVAGLSVAGLPVVGLPVAGLSVAGLSVAGLPVAGLRAEYFANNRLEGEPRVVRTDEAIDFGWTLNAPARGIPFDWYSVRWTGRITAPDSTSVRRLGVEGNDGYRLWIDDSLVIDNWIKRSYGTRFAEVAFASGSGHDIRLEYYESTGNARVKLVWDAGIDGEAWRAEVDSAVRVARAADVAVIVAGIEEGEFRDRARLALPGHQEEMIRAVAATGTPAVVVLIGGSAITMSDWLPDVDAVLDAWYPGEEGGNAVADVLFGRYDPAGRLPITFPLEEGQLPLTYDHKPTGRGDDYVDLSGQPLFPFGYGLSYTTFEYSDLRITPDTMSPTGQATVRATVTNTGARAGDEVVQLYVRDVLASVARPVMQLQGFARVHLAPGERREVTFVLGEEHLRMLDADMRWVVEPGAFRVMVGASSKDIRLRGELVVQ